MGDRRLGTWERPARAGVILATAFLILAMLVTPADAHVSSSTSHLWKSHVKPLVLKLFYTKSQANRRYYTKTQTETRLSKRVGPQDYCWYAERNPRSFPAAPCRSQAVTLDGPETLGYSSSVAIGADGNPIVVYFDYTLNHLKLIHCQTTDCSVGDAPRTLDSSGMNPSIAIGADGLPVIAYYLSGLKGDLMFVRCTTTDCSTVTPPRGLETKGDVGQNPKIVIGKDGLPAIAYAASLRGTIEFIRCTALDCSSHNPKSVLVYRSTPAFDLAIGVDGFPVLSTHNWTNRDLNLVHCTTVDCSTRDSVRTLDDNRGAGRDGSSIAVGTDGYPVVSYIHGWPDGTLLIVHCENVSCSKRSKPYPVGSGANDNPPAMAIGTDGNPVISYYVGNSEDLFIARCAVPSCSSSHSPRTIDSSGDVGRRPDLAIGIDGRAVISYYDRGRELLRFIQVK